MKLTYYTTLLLCTLLFSNLSFGSTNNSIPKTEIDSSACKNSYIFELTGNVNPITAKQVTDYILNKTGICDVKIDVFAKKITFYVTDEIDIESLKGLIKYSHHHFLLEDIHSETPEK